VVNLHLPQMDAAYVSWIARVMGRPVVTTYHCDMRLPAGFIHRVANQGAHFASHMTGLASNLIVTNTRDYAEHSDFLRVYMDKLRFIAPPIELPVVSEAEIRDFQQKYNIGAEERIIGMNARLATEKGVEYLIEAMPEVIKKYPNARVLHVGQYQNVLGEEQYAEKLAPLINQLGKHWTFLGVLSPVEQAAFFHSSEVLVLPSINSTESFGMVQVEAMICGTPAVASDIPGVRCAVRETGMGRIVPARDPHALAEGVIAVLDHPEQYRGDAAAIRQQFSTESVARKYETLFKELLSEA
jgi:glycosyltransferase involved in cell wall biosynthesis